MTDYQSGFEVAGYRIESVIGRGGMAVVYRAEDTRLGRKVALKVLTPVLAHNEQFQQRFIRESRLAASLDHPNIVPIYEAGEADGQLFIAMRYVAGSDLKGLLSQTGGLPLARLLRIFVQIGDALDAAHELGLVHRDVKPGNILVASTQERTGHGYFDHVYLTDFGLTKRTTSLSGALTGTGHFLGTVDYVSPEQIQGAPVGPSTDIYALGCVLYECLTGQLPFHRDDDAALLWAHLVEAPPPVTSRAPRPARGRRRRGRPGDGQGAGGPVRLLPRPGARPRARARRRRPAPGHDPHQPPGSRQPRPVSRGRRLRQRVRWSRDRVRGRGRVGAGPDERLGVAPLVPARGDRAGAGGGRRRRGPRRGHGPGPDLRPRRGRRAVRRVGGRLGQRRGGVLGRGRPAAPEGATPTRRRRRWLVIAIAAATLVVLMVVAVVFLLPSRTAETFRTFVSPGTIVPYTVSHPQSWSEQNGVASDAVLSPRPDAVGHTFFQGSADRWGGTRRLMATSPADAVGLYVYAESTASDTTTDGLKSAIDVLLPDRLTFEPMHRQLTIDGSPADELEGVLEDPANPKTKLHVLFDVVQPRGGGSVLLAFFAPPDRFDDQRPLFDRIRDGVRFTD